MTNTDDRQHRSILQRIAHRAMIERGLVPDFPPQVLAELDEIYGPATRAEESTRDLRNLLWCSIDNDDSRDLDQLTVAQGMPDGAVRVWCLLQTNTRFAWTLSSFDKRVKYDHFGKCDPLYMAVNDCHESAFLTNYPLKAGCWAP